MSEQLPDRPDERHPIVTGLVALVGVALAVGLILGLVVAGGARVLGIGGGEDAEGGTSDRSMYLPRPEKTPTASGPQITLAPGDEGSKPPKSKGPKATHTASPRKQISLSAGATSVAPMAQLDLTGVYPGGEGAILQVQRFSAGRWQDFPVTASVSNETFSTYVQTSQPGVNRFRVVDTDSGLQSNEVRVTIG